MFQKRGGVTPLNNPSLLCIIDRTWFASIKDHFGARLVTAGAGGELYARTGYLGFLRRTEAVGADGDFHDAVFVVGSLDETLMLRGMRYHPIDIENSVMRSHKKIAGN